MKLNDYLQLPFHKRGDLLIEGVREFYNSIIETGENAVVLDNREKALTEFLGVMAGYMITRSPSVDLPIIVPAMLRLAYCLGSLGVDKIVASIDGDLENTGDLVNFINGLEI